MWETPFLELNRVQYCTHMNNASVKCKSGKQIERRHIGKKRNNELKTLECMRALLLIPVVHGPNTAAFLMS
jgi:hypothetical protein